MNNKGTFFITAVLTTAVFVAGHFATATKDGPAERPVAASTGTVIMDECQVTGKLTRKDDGVYAVFCAENATGADRSLNFYYAVTCTPSMSMVSRMMPLPKEVDKGCVALTAEAGKSIEHEVLVQRSPVVAEKAKDVNPAHPVTQSNILLSSPEIWVLTVSLDDSSQSPAGGGAPIVTAGGRAVTGKGRTVLARTTRKAPKINS
ncbi:MAG: hypothetical protein QGI24_02835 [Kiritimatiellia bacterium]|jgi:hypothetical protein|nr:hypothetical protein [Kiritimatiellia bacterium]